MMKFLFVLLLSRCILGRHFSVKNSAYGNEATPTQARKNDTAPDHEMNNSINANGDGERNATEGSGEPISILFEEPYQLADDEEWPEVCMRNNDERHSLFHFTFESSICLTLLEPIQVRKRLVLPSVWSDPGDKSRRQSVSLDSTHQCSNFQILGHARVNVQKRTKVMRSYSLRTYTKTLAHARSGLLTIKHIYVHTNREKLGPLRVMMGESVIDV